jgi:HSP20 family protein
MNRLVTLDKRSPYRVLDEMDRVFNSVFTGESRVKQPAVDVEEFDDKYEIRAELPGFSDKDLEIEVEQNRISIKAEKDEVKSEKADDEKTYLLRERYHSSYQRSFSLPSDVNQEQIDARLSNGLLTLTLTKKEEAKPRKINIS